MLCPPQHAHGHLTQALLSSSSFATAAKPVARTDNTLQSQTTAHFAPQTTSPSGFAALLIKARQAQNGRPRDATTPTIEVQRTTASLPPQTPDVAETITRITRAIRSIYHSPSSDAGLSYQDVYLETERIVIAARKGEELYDRVKIEMERAIGDVARSLHASASSLVGNANSASADLAPQISWLRQLSDAWTVWREKLSLVCSVLAVLDRAHVLGKSDILSLWDLGLQLFQSSIVANYELNSRAQESIVAASNGTRKNATSTYRSLHRELLSIYSTLKEYENLESTMLQATHEFYAAEARDSISRLDIASYLAHAQDLLSKDTDISSWLYVDEAGQRKAHLAARLELIQAHASALLDGLPTLLQTAATASLVLIYDYLDEAKDRRSLREAFGKYIYTHGEGIVLDKDEDDTMIERLLSYKAVIDGIILTAFKSDAEFRQVQKDSFERFVNKRENKTAELIAKFLDARLRSGNKTMSDREMEHILNETLVLFRYCHAKDMFEEFYKRLFAKRLLLNRSASSDAEQSMLLKLKEECGPAFTQKLETMLTDISLSDEMMQGFASLQANAANKGNETFELNVNVLTQAHWPTYPQTQLIIPPEMAQATEQFADYYETRNQGRKLHWAHTLGTTSMIAQFAKAGEKELLVSEFQTIVLLLFNDVPQGGKLSYAEIRARTGLEDKELKRTLQSLACGQIPTRVLRKDPQGKDVHDDDVFHVNEGLKNERKRIRINMIQLNETQEEQKSTVDRVMFDRELVLQATAVRILKAKKTIKHAELLQEIVQQIASRFTVDVSEIKKTFEVLIDKEYMERVEGQRGMYRYLA